MFNYSVRLCPFETLIPTNFRERIICKGSISFAPLGILSKEVFKKYWIMLNVVKYSYETSEMMSILTEYWTFQMDIMFPITSARQLRNNK
jgi:hypothetical protein